jgi:hypothetical protein
VEVGNWKRYKIGDSVVVARRFLYWLLSTSVGEKGSLGFHRQHLSLGQVGLSYRNCKGIVLVHQRTHRGRDSKPSGKTCTGCRRGLSQISSSMSYQLDGLIHQLDALTYGPASGCPAIIMVQSTHDRTSHYLLACILRGRNRSEPFRYLLRNPLMWACLVEVPHIRIQNALELLLLQNQQVVQAFLSHTC